jgi:hypothetical protein
MGNARSILPYLEVLRTVLEYLEKKCIQAVVDISVSLSSSSGSIKLDVRPSMAIEIQVQLSLAYLSKIDLGVDEAATEPLQWGSIRKIGCTLVILVLVPLLKHSVSSA